MMQRKTQLSAAVGAALLALGTTAFAQTPPTVQVYGQVSRALMHADDGTQNKWFHVDNEASGTRLGVTGVGQAIPGLRAGFRIEFDFQSNESQRVTFTPQAGTTGPQSSFSAADEDHGGFAERHADAWVEGSWGRINIGQGDGASNGATESDLSGTGMANGIGVADLGGGINYRNLATGALGPNVNSTINQQDFESRYDRLMYVTPTFGGLRAQISWGQKPASGVTPTATVTGATPATPGGAVTTASAQSVSANTDVKEASLWYGAKMGGLGEVAAAAGYSTRGASGPGLTHDVYWGGSASWLHTSGFNVTGSYSARDQPTTTAGATVRKSKFTYLKIGYKAGPHAIAIDTAWGDDFGAAGDEAKMWGIGYVWNPLRFLELYAAYKVHSLDAGSGREVAGVKPNFEDVKITTIGTRVRF